jgi:conjugative relaxase-like TrwC/TraI family protein
MRLAHAFGVVMLSIAAIGSSEAALRYYAELEHEASYYVAEKAPSAWWGAGARALGLEGKPVRETELSNLLRGYAPDGSRSLVQQIHGSKRHKRHPGDDLTFSAEKGPSLLWALGSPSQSRAVEHAKRGGCIAGLSFVESRVTTRRGKDGRRLEGCGLVVALFRHGESRAGDPQLHTHALVVNLGLRKDGTWGALHTPSLFELKMAAGAVFRAEFARGLREAGIRLEPGKHGFQVAGFSAEVLREFSTRRREIEASLASRGEVGPKAAAYAALRTRRPKVHRQPDELRADWLARALRYGITQDKISQLFGQEGKQPEVSRRVIDRVIAKASEKLAHERSGYTEKDLIRSTARALEHHGPASKAITAGVKEFLSDTRRVARVPEMRRGEERFAPIWLVEKEQALLAMAESSKAERRGLRARAVAKSLRAHPHLSDEQRAALRHVTLGDGAIKCVVGLPGAGKTELLHAVREAFERGGRRVIGAALSAEIARELEQASGIPSVTVSRLLRTAAPTRKRILKHHVHQMARAARGRKTWKLEREKIGRKTVLVLDKASAISTVQIEPLIQRVRQAGGKVVLLGGHRELPAIQAGGAFAALCRTLGAAELTSVHRQQRLWMRKATKELADGDVRAALSLYAQRGRVLVYSSAKEAVTGLVAAWGVTRTADLRDTLILGETKGEVKSLNLAAQEHRRKEKALGSAIRIGATIFREGDRVVMTSQHKGLGVLNGDRGTLECVHALVPNRFARVSVRLDREDKRGRQIRISFYPSSFKSLELGYASTAHRAQEAKKTFILGGGWMQGRELALVQMTRHTDDARLFVTKHDAGTDLAILAGSMSKSRGKEFALSPPVPSPEVERAT